MSDLKLLDKLLRKYALKGVADWRDADPKIKTMATCCLKGMVVENADDIESVINQKLHRRFSAPMFIPMAAHTDKIKKAFFIPIFEQHNNKVERVTIHLFMIVAKLDDDETSENEGFVRSETNVERFDGDARHRCLAFRWEQADHNDSAHGYAHVQMCTNVLRNRPWHLGIPKWLPQSYPAFPICTNDPVEMFLSMATAVHGYGGNNDMRQMIRSIFESSNIGDANTARKCSNTLKGLLKVKLND